MYKFPLSIPVDRKLEVTQLFKSTELVEFYRSKGLNINVHDAVDVTCGNAVQTYGTPFVCPFPLAELDRINEADAENGKSGMVQVKYYDNDGNELILGGVHLSGTINKARYREGDILGYIGNYGVVLPEPTIGQPFNGSHIHLYLIKNKVFVDPLLYFDLRNPYRSSDTGNERDVFAIRWAIRKIKESLAMLMK